MKIPITVKTTKHYNLKTRTGELAEGCKRCVRGEKLVLFVTGLCGNGCSYCPVSDEKNLHDVTYANEWKITSDDELLKEAEMMSATGAGITGGDPLATPERTCHYIRLLKKTYGEDFHIHLYTPLLRVNEKTLKQLYEAGLDEIRFHPKLDDETDWPRLLIAKKFDWQVGIEIPAIPEFEENMKRLIDYVVENKIADFMNLNEFEYADNKVFELNKKKTNKTFEPKNTLSYAVKGSEETSIRLLDYAEKKGLATHFCTAKSKDAIQLAKRIKRRSEKAAAIYDAVDEEGLLTRGAVYDQISIEDVGFTDKLKSLPAKEKEDSIRRLEQLRKKIIEELDVPEELIELDEERLRLLTTTSLAEHLAKTLNNPVFIVKEYPTHDCLIVQAEKL